MYFTTFLDNFQETIADKFGWNSEVLYQEDVKSFMQEHIDDDSFPMICREYTKDSIFDTILDDSKFLNWEEYDHFWVSVDDTTFLCLHEISNATILVIDVIEVHENFRGQNIGKTLVKIIETCGEGFFKQIIVQPYDSSSELFWKHMGYEENEKSYGLCKSL